VGRAGIYRSTNGGKRWVRKGRKVFYNSNLAIDPGSPFTVYRVRRDRPRVFKSSDGDASWAPKDKGLPHGGDLAIG
jgi:hypothetical protein